MFDYLVWQENKYQCQGKDVVPKGQNGGREWAFAIQKQVQGWVTRTRLGSQFHKDLDSRATLSPHCLWTAVGFLSGDRNT